MSVNGNSLPEGGLVSVLYGTDIVIFYNISGKGCQIEKNSKKKKNAANISISKHKTSAAFFVKTQNNFCVATLDSVKYSYSVFRFNCSNTETDLTFDYNRL